MMHAEDRAERDDTERTLRVQDAVGFLVTRWRRLAIVFGVAAVSLVAMVWAARAGQVWPVRATVLLTFKGIEIHQYPTGKPFDYKELTSPAVVAAAQRTGNLAHVPDTELSGLISVTPLTPPSVVSRWQQQDRQGQQRDTFYPNEFQITVAGGRLSREERFAFLKAVVDAYQQQLRDQLYVSEFRVADPVGDGEDWKRTIDPFELPELIGQSVTVMRGSVSTLRGSADSTSAVRFADLAAEIDLYQQGSLAGLTGVTYSNGVTNNRELILAMSGQRLRDLSKRLEEEKRETALLTDMLAKVDRPQFFMPNIAGTNRPVEVNSDVIGTLLRNDYYADLIRRSLNTGDALFTIESQLAELQRRLAVLSAGGATPPGYAELADRAVSGFRRVRDRYRQLVTGYFDLVAASHVRLKNGPYVDASARTPASMIALAIMGIALLVAVLGVRLHEMVAQARKHA